VFLTINHITEFPNVWPILKEEIRRCQTKRFPYGVLYSIEPNEHIFILAVMNLHRSPSYWEKRFKS
jgi:hypothetical protein